jgi:hypothetical protein
VQQDPRLASQLGKCINYVRAEIREERVEARASQ